MQARRGRWTIVAAVLACAVLLTIYRGAAARTALAWVAGMATQTHIGLGRMDLHPGDATLTGISVRSKAGEPIAYIPRLDLQYALRDLLPGSRHRFGLRSVLVEHPQITVIRHPDGTYNIPLLSQSAGGRESSPLVFYAKVTGGTLTMIDRSRVNPIAQHLYIDNFNLVANIDTSARSHYSAGMDYREGNRRYPIAGTGNSDALTGFVLHHWTAAYLPLPRLVDFALNNPALRMKRGALQDVQLRYFGKLAASAYMNDVVVSMAGVQAPIENGHGPLDMYENGLTTQALDATIAGVPVHVHGGVYDLNAPQFHMALEGHGDLAHLKRIAAAASTMPVRGAVDFALLLEGSLKDPLTLISVRSHGLQYNRIPLREARALIAFDGKEADVLRAGAAYGSFGASTRGRIALRSGPNAIEMVARVNGPSANLPYAPALVSAMPLSGTLLALAPNFKNVTTHGIIAGSNSSERLAGVFDVTAAGVGTIGPLTIERPSSSLFAQLSIDRPRAKMAALLQARNFAIRPAGSVALPGMRMPALPNAAATLNGDLYGEQSGSRLGLAGDIDLRKARYGTIAIDSGHAQFGGNLGDVTVSRLSVRGPFGRLDAAGTISGTSRSAIEGRYRGSLAALSQIAGGSMAAQGSVDAPIALVYDAGRTIAQVQGARFSRAAVGGVPVSRLSATLGTQGKRIDVYAAQATIAQHADAVAIGTLGAGSRSVALSVANLDVRSLPGVPLRAGTADAAAQARGSLESPSVNGAAVLTGGIYQSYPVDANTAFAYGGNALQLRDASVALGPAFIGIDGTIGGIALNGPMVPQYDLNASLNAADAHALAAMVQPQLARDYVEGSIDAIVHVGGAGASPYLAGSIAAPEGSLNGLAFRDLRAQIAGTPSDLAVRDGRVAVGSTALAFDAALAPGTLAASVSAPKANLADFNDYFDTGDTLAGVGHVALSVRRTPAALGSNGTVALSGVRYRRFDIGNAAANWHESGRNIALTANVGGASGTGRVAGTVDIAARALNLEASARNVDLGTWVPMAGLTAPVTGKADVDASVSGRYPDVSMAANASVRDGTVGRVRVLRAQVAATAAHGRGRVIQATVQIPYFTATGSGTFGLRPRDSIAIAVRGTSPDIGQLVRSVSGKPVQFAGALDTTLRVDGTPADPRLSDDFTLAGLRYQNLSVPRVHALLGATRTLVTLRQGTIDLQKGTVLATGSVPIRMTPQFAVGPGNAPVSLRLTANGVDAANLANALPHGTTLRGRIDGTMNIGGRVDSPLLGGALTLANGYFVGPVDQNPVSDAAGRLAFSGTQASLQGVHADVGGGLVTMSGSARVPNVRDIRDLTFSSTVIAKGAQFNSPQYFRGKADATLEIFRRAGGVPTVAGNLFIPSGRIPLTAFWNPKAPKTPAQPSPNIAFNLTTRVGDDVRVQAPNVDVGARGLVKVGGTLPHPTLQGRLVATGGTINFLHRFVIENADVRFDPSNGIMPYVDAVATTTVQNPTTYVAMHVSGLAPDNMNVDFTSDPTYNKSQIVGLLVGAQALGAVSGVQTTGGGSFAPAGVVQNLALGQLNNYFTTQLLEPMSVALGNSLGFQNLQLTDDFTSGFGVAAAKAFGKHVTLRYNENLGSPKRQSLDLEVHHGQSTAFDLMMYDVQSPAIFGFTQTNSLLALSGIPQAQMFDMVSGTNGISLMYEHKW